MPDPSSALRARVARPRRGGWVAGALVVSSAAACGDDAVVAVSPDPGASCRAPERPHGFDRLRLDPVFPQVLLENKVALVWRPGDATVGYVVTQSGTLWRFDAVATGAPEAVVDLTDEVAFDGESGLLDVAFHPRFPEVPEAFFSLVTRRAVSGSAEQLYSRIVRMSSADGGATFDRSTESVVLEVEQPYSNHKGGELAFGPDGFLYYGLGDGGGAGDPFENGQNLDVLLGKMLRIDIDGAAPYAIPPDNPFAAGGGRPEIYAVGFRNPWRFSFDPASGDLWVGDVGQNEWEEIDKVTRGSNYGWSITEGPSCFDADTCDHTGLTAPIAQYRNTGGTSVIGGPVLRGTRWGALEGTYLYSDFSSGLISGIAPEPVAGGRASGEGAPVDLGGGAGGVAAWSINAEGAVYAVFYGGGLSELVTATVGPDRFPRKLSETGCVDVDHPREALGGAVPYEVGISFWSDGADKARFVAVGRGETGRGDSGDGVVTVDASGDWDLPSGTVLVKSFFRGETPIETRLLVHHDDGQWAGYGYAWRLDGSDADYVERGFEEMREGAPWFFPATHDCEACHTSVAGHSLGLRTDQMAVGDQLSRLVDAGVLESVPAGAALPAIEGPAPVAERARAYLEVNCSMCHQPKGPAGRARLDLRFATDFTETGLCNAEPNAGALDIEDAVIVAPGDPARSILSARLHAVGDAHMPPVGITSIDEAGAAVVDDWIRSLEACP